MGILGILLGWIDVVCVPRLPGFGICPCRKVWFLFSTLGDSGMIGSRESNFSFLSYSSLIQSLSSLLSVLWSSEEVLRWGSRVMVKY